MARWRVWACVGSLAVYWCRGCLLQGRTPHDTRHVERERRESDVVREACVCEGAVTLVAQAPRATSSNARHVAW